MYECAVKEAEEEASIPPSLSKAAKFVSFQKTCYHTRHYVKPEVNYIFDLKLPEEFTPVVNDGEAQNFKRVKLDENFDVFDDLSQWKPNSMAITLDFCIRKGLLRLVDAGFENLRRLFLGKKTICWSWIGL